jgi:imidazoleglycerol phosphate dehydratase HisB
MSKQNIKRLKTKLEIATTIPYLGHMISLFTKKKLKSKIEIATTIPYMGHMISLFYV